MYNIIIKSNTINKTYNNVNHTNKCYKLIIDTYRLFKYNNDNSFSIVVHDSKQIVLRLNNKHCITRESMNYKHLIYKWRAYA